MKKILTLSLSAMMLAPLADARPAYNVALVSDYLFRGVSQTDNSIALQGGADVKQGNAYASAWFSNVEKPDGAEGLPVEMDISFGYNNKFSGFNLDTEILTYNYLNDATADETEFKFGTSPSKSLTIDIYRGIKGNYWYPEIKIEKYLPNRFYFDASVGYTLYDDQDDDTLNGRVELARDFPEFNGLDIFLGATYVEDSVPGNDVDDDDEVNFFFGLRKRF
ncbi:TorF family putative porin [Bermanella sp. R86510]|uniref:TorF family putative porin n=1 Tax=unclassified Bermanella TaxID=2627862 RepID=UPI0037C9143B